MLPGKQKIDISVSVFLLLVSLHEVGIILTNLFEPRSIPVVQRC